MCTFGTRLAESSVAHSIAQSPWPLVVRQGGAGLDTLWGWETAQRMLYDAGFASVRRYVLPHDPMNVWFVSSAR